MQIKLRHLSKAYKTGIETIEVLTEIDLTIESGSWLTITGPSGSGKTRKIAKGKLEFHFETYEKVRIF